MAELKHLSLFSGSGIGTLAAKQCGIATVAHCENDPACCYALERLWPDAPLFKDIHDVSAKSLWERGATDIDIISGGFPCQDLSCAGKGAGIEGSRSGLWREMFRVIRQVRPRWILIENVPAIKLRGVDRVLAPLERIGYTVWPLVVGAWSVGAPHKRDRVWIVGKLADSTREPGQQRTIGDGVGQCSELRGPDQLGHAGLRGIVERTRGPRSGTLRQQPIGEIVGGNGAVADATKRPRKRSKPQPAIGQLSDGNGAGNGMADAEHPQPWRGTGQEPPSEQRRDRLAIDCDDGGIGRSSQMSGMCMVRSEGQPRTAMPEVRHNTGERGDYSEDGTARGGDIQLRCTMLAESDSTGGRGQLGDTLGNRLQGIGISGEGSGEYARSATAGTVDAGGGMAHPSQPDNGGRTHADKDMATGGETQRCRRQPNSDGTLNDCQAGHHRWPSRPGQAQYGWESPRLVVSDVGCITHGVSPRVFGRANKAMLRMLGNAWTYPNALLMFQAIAHLDKSDTASQ